MPIQEGTEYTIDSALTVVHVKQVYDSITNQNSAEMPEKLDLSAVPAIDSAGLQLLCTLKKHALSQDRAFTLDPVSQPVAEAISFAQLNDFFDERSSKGAS